MNADQELGWAGIEFAAFPQLSMATSSAAGAVALPPVEFYATGWQGTLDRPIAVDVQSQAIEQLELSVIPIRLQSKLPKTIGFAFPEAHDFLPPEPTPEPSDAKKQKPLVNIDLGNVDPDASQSDAASQKKKKWTRIKPPGDLVKLEDRLYFVPASA